MDRRQFISWGSTFLAQAFWRECVPATKEASDIQSAANRIESTQSNTFPLRVGIFCCGKSGMEMAGSIDRQPLGIARIVAIDDGLPNFSLMESVDVLIKADFCSDSMSVLDYTHLRMNQHASAQIAHALADLDVVFVVVGLGDLSGTSIAAHICEMTEKKQYCVAFSTIPCTDGHPFRSRSTQPGYQTLNDGSDLHLSIFLGERSSHFGDDMPTVPTTAEAQLALSQLLMAQCYPLTHQSLLSVDVSDFRRIASFNRETQQMPSLGWGRASGNQRAGNAMNLALRHSQISRYALERMSSAHIAIRSTKQSIKLWEIRSALDELPERLRHDESIFVTVDFDEALLDDFEVIVLASTTFT